MRRKNRVLPVATLCLAAGLAAAGCDSSLPLIDGASDWDQREQDRNDTGAIIEDITGNPKSWTDGSFNTSGIGAPPAGLGRNAEPAVWSQAAQAWVSSGVTIRNGVDWDWTFLLRILDGLGNTQQAPDGTTERIEVVLTTDGERVFSTGGVVTEQTMSWLILGEITGMGTGTLDVSVAGVLDSRAIQGSVLTELPGEFSVDAGVPEDTDECPSGSIILRIADFTVLGTLDPVGQAIDWEAYVGVIEPGEEPFDRDSIPFECEAAP